MTIGIIILGTLLYRTFRHWKRSYSLFPRRWTLDSLYNNLLIRLEDRSTKITSFYMTGLLRHYLVYIYVFLILAVGGTLFYTGAFSVDMTNDTPITTFVVIIFLVMITTSVMILVAKSRLTAILFNGVLSFSVVMLLYIFRSIDIAHHRIFMVLAIT